MYVVLKSPYNLPFNYLIMSSLNIIRCSFFSKTCFTNAFFAGSIDVRLVGGQFPNVGRVEVYFNNQWGTVCSNGWSNDDARVICRQLGYPEGNHQALRYSRGFGRTTGPIWLVDVFCTGTENNITECSHNGWGNNGCSHYHDAGVICLNGKFLKVVPFYQRWRRMVTSFTLYIIQ